ncbi:MAG: LptE family protein [Candidatus Firestonebacteria bacterium]
MKRYILLALAVSVLLGGCSAMKPLLSDAIKSLAIPTFVNKTTQYDLETPLTNAVIKQFQVDGRLVVASPEKADAKLEGTIRQYILQPMLYDVNNVIVQYKMKMVLDLKFTDLKTGKELWFQKELGGITGGTTTYNVSGSGIETETEARQKVFYNLAAATVNRVIYGWENY